MIMLFLWDQWMHWTVLLSLIPWSVTIWETFHWRLHFKISLLKVNDTFFEDVMSFVLEWKRWEGNRVAIPRNGNFIRMCRDIIFWCGAKLVDKGWHLLKSKQTRFAPKGSWWHLNVRAMTSQIRIFWARSMLFTVCGPQVCSLLDTSIYFKRRKCPTFFKEPWCRVKDT